MKVGSFGSVIFEVSDTKVVTPEGIQHECKARFEEHKVLGAPPRLEFLAPELESMSMNIRLRADMGVHPLREAITLVKLCKEGAVRKLIIMEASCGDMVIESISQSWRHVGPQGIYIVDLSIKFKEYI